MEHVLFINSLTVVLCLIAVSILLQGVKKTNRMLGWAVVFIISFLMCVPQMLITTAKVLEDAALELIELYRKK